MRTGALWVIATVAAVWWLRAASVLLVPIALAACISYALEPIVAWMSRVMPRIAAASLLLMVVLGAASWGLYSLRDEAADAMGALPQAAHRVRELLTARRSSGPASSIRQAAAELQGRAGSSSEASSPPAPAPQSGGIIDVLERGAGSAFALAGNIVTVVFLVFFLLASGDHFSNRVIEVAGNAEHRAIASQIVRDINGQIQRFLLVRAITGTAVGLATWGALMWLETPQAAVWAICAAVFNSIPYFGPVIVSGGLFVVGMVQGGGLSGAIQMSGAALVITSLEGWVLTPPLLGKAERMSAVVVFLGLLFWTWVWGAWGTLLAVPMLVVIKSVADHVERLTPISRLMAP